MNLRNAIEEYANAVSSRDYYDHHSDARRVAEVIRECRQNLDALLAVAEAAIALSEHQAFTAFDPEVEAVVYYQERDKLWLAFMQAHKAAKEMNQS